jgi:hypothetical protein
MQYGTYDLQLAYQYALERLVRLGYGNAAALRLLDHLHYEPPREGTALACGNAGAGNTERGVEVL